MLCCVVMCVWCGVVYAVLNCGAWCLFRENYFIWCNTISLNNSYRTNVQFPPKILSKYLILFYQKFLFEKLLPVVFCFLSPTLSLLLLDLPIRDVELLSVPVNVVKIWYYNRIVFVLSLSYCLEPCQLMLCQYHILLCVNALQKKKQ